MISANKALIARTVPIRAVLSQLSFELLDDAVKQARCKRIGDFLFQAPVARELAFLLSQLAFRHQMALRHTDADRAEEFR